MKPLDHPSSLIRITELKRTYTQGNVSVEALRGVDLEIGRAEFSALAGPSGSGKTTLLNLIGCLDSPTQGQIIVDQQDVTTFNRARAAEFRLNHIGFVFQAYNLVPVLSALENAEFILMLQGVTKNERRKIVEPLLIKVGLADELHRTPGELSGGQQQRVAIVRAIASKPSIVLADEPTANLDSETSEDLIDMMLELNQESQITFLFSTHDQLVMDRARRLIKLKSGQVDSDEHK